MHNVYIVTTDNNKKFINSCFSAHDSCFVQMGVKFFQLVNFIFIKNLNDECIQQHNFGKQVQISSSQSIINEKHKKSTSSLTFLKENMISCLHHFKNKREHNKSASKRLQTLSQQSAKVRWAGNKLTRQNSHALSKRSTYIR